MAKAGKLPAFSPDAPVVHLEDFLVRIELLLDQGVVNANLRIQELIAVENWRFEPHERPITGRIATKRNADNESDTRASLTEPYSFSMTAYFLP